MSRMKDTFRKVNPLQEAEKEIIDQQVAETQNPTPKLKAKSNRFLPIDNDKSFDTVNQNIIWNSVILLEMANEMYS